MSEIDWSDVAKEMRKSLSLPRKHASFFHWHKKDVMELHLCSLLVGNLEKNGESGFTKITEGGDPPDCIVSQSSVEFAIEVTELVVQESIEEQVKKNLAYVFGPEWTEPFLTKKLNTILAKKDNPKKKEKLRKKYGRYVLLIHTDESELDSESFKRLFKKDKLISTSLIDEAYVVFSYDPRLNEEPIIRIK
ncbi:MAG: hypothetical protein OEX12_10020 [Gammaproteobacteria bacterium]|nr:hypothetical protein [Gammaproteobacteria bacterium]